MRKIVLAFIAFSIFDVSGMNARTFWFFNNRRPAPAQPVVRYKLRDLKLMRPPLVFEKIKRLPNSAPVTRTFANKELGNISFSNSMHKSVSLNGLSDEGLDNISSMMIADNELSSSNSIHRSVSLNSLPNEELGNISSSNIMHKSVNWDEFLEALDAIERSSNSENLNYWEISCKVSLSDNKAELRCLAKRNDLKDVYIIGTFPAGFSMNALGLKNDRPCYYSGKGMEQDLYKGFFQSLKARCLQGDCKIYEGDYDSKNNKLIYGTILEYLYKVIK